MRIESCNCGGDKGSTLRIQEMEACKFWNKTRVPWVANMQKGVSRAAEAMPRDELQDEQPKETKDTHGARVTFGMCWIWDVFWPQHPKVLRCDSETHLESRCCASLICHMWLTHHRSWGRGGSVAGASCRSDLEKQTKKDPPKRKKKNRLPIT